jgi:Xaa-Pro aminopeptidase
MKTQNIDGVARRIIRDAGYGEHFGHSLGHGIGLDVHEYPYVSWTRGERVRNGMVFTIEPGIYVPGLGGVRIEDVVLVRDGSVSILTNLSREAEGGVL